MKKFTTFFLFVILPLALIVALVILLAKISGKEAESLVFDESELFI